MYGQAPVLWRHAKTAHMAADLFVLGANAAGRFTAGHHIGSFSCMAVSAARSILTICIWVLVYMQSCVLP